MDEHQARVRAALYGSNDDRTREQFRIRFDKELADFESAVSVAYQHWSHFDAQFAKTRDSGMVVGTLFACIARLTTSCNLLTLGQLTLSGGAFRHAIEALACAFLFADHRLPHLRDVWLDRFSVNKAVWHLKRIASKDQLFNVEGVQKLLEFHAFYNKYSHPTPLALADVIDIGAGGHQLGSSFDQAKVPFYVKELSWRTGFATNVLPGAIHGTASRMHQWPVGQ